MILAQQTKIVTGMVPQDANGGKTADYISLKNYNHCTVIVQCGSIAATCNITINKATDVSASGATSFAFDAYWYNANVNAYNGEDSTSTDTLTKSTGASGTIATGATSNQIFIIEIDAEELRTGSATNYDCLAAVISDPSGSNTMSVLYILSQPRYADDSPPTAITD